MKKGGFFKPKTATDNDVIYKVDTLVREQRKRESAAMRAAMQAAVSGMVEARTSLKKFLDKNDRPFPRGCGEHCPCRHSEGK